MVSGTGGGVYRMNKIIVKSHLANFNNTSIKPVCQIFLFACYLKLKSELFKAER